MDLFKYVQGRSTSFFYMLKCDQVFSKQIITDIRYLPFNKCNIIHYVFNSFD